MEKLLLQHVWIIVLILLWTLPWKAAALWRSARRAQMGWFLAMIILNTLGILEIVYIFFFSKKETKPQEQTDQTFKSKFKTEGEKNKEKVSKKMIM